MTFLEKDLETIIFENWKRIHDRGLYAFMRARYVARQVRLDPYGVADLIAVSIRDVAPIYEEQGQGFRRVLKVTIVECKQDLIDVSAYMQVKRYETSIMLAAEYFRTQHTLLEVRTALIGRTIQTNGDFAFVLNSDATCDAYTYTYDYEGIQFKRDEKQWRKTERIDSSFLHSANDIVTDIFKSFLKDQYAAQSDNREIPF